jgi:hypothetical protein
MSEFTEQDLQAALNDELRAIHAEYLAELKQPGEFTVYDYMAANNLTGKGINTARGILERLTDENKLTVRVGRHENGKIGNIYRRVIK